MAAIIQSMQIAGYPSVANSGNPATGAGLLGSRAITYWDDGAITFTNAAGQTKKINNTPDVNALLQMILVGTNGLSTVKSWQV